jgi:hypothetical protein
MTQYVVSTLTAPQEYTGWERGASRLPSKKKTVRINGGANLANRHLVTPEGGIVTRLQEGDAAFLKSHKIFLLHEKNGFVKILNQLVLPPDGGKESLDMAKRDQSSPDTPADFIEADTPDGKVKVNKRAQAKLGESA